MSGILHHVLQVAMAHVFLATSLVFFVFGGLFTYLIDRAKPRRGWLMTDLANHYFPWAHWRTPTIRVDAAFFVVTKYTQGYIAIISTFVTVSVARGIEHGLSGVPHGPAPLFSGTIALFTAATAMYVFGDLGEFISHWLQHTISPLWEFHKVHHSSTFLTPMTAYRSHPISNIIDGVMMGFFAAVPAGVAAYACGFSFDQLLVISGSVNLAFTVGLLGVLQHSHFPISFGPLERFIVSPLMHQVHHSTKPEHWNKNYGSRLSIWDWCIGTLVIPPKGERIQFGLNPVEDQRGDYSSLLWCYAGPFINCGKMLWRTAPAGPVAGAVPSRGAEIG